LLYGLCLFYFFPPYNISFFGFDPIFTLSHELCGKHLKNSLRPTWLEGTLPLHTQK
jgi:hypothetical protein